MIWCLYKNHIINRLFFSRELHMRYLRCILPSSQPPAQHAIPKNPGVMALWFNQLLCNDFSPSEIWGKIRNHKIVDLFFFCRVLRPQQKLYQKRIAKGYLSFGDWTSTRFKAMVWKCPDISFCSIVQQILACTSSGRRFIQKKVGAFWHHCVFKEKSGYHSDTGSARGQVKEGWPPSKNHHAPRDCFPERCSV